MTKEDLKKSLNIWAKALATLGEILPEKETTIVRDATIKRFEYNFELAWKTIKRFAIEEGENCNSPKSAFKEALKLNWIEDDDIWLDMLSDRNLSTHTYQESTADAIYHRIPEHYKACLINWKKSK